jgi:predicted porin
MKKSLVALAVLAATGAFAQSTVTLSGIIKAGVASNNYSGSATTANNGSNIGVADGSSRFALSGSEDLGGGLRANFAIETRFRADEAGGGAGTGASGQVAGGNTFVGLSGGFGAVQIGRLDTHYCFGSDQHGTRATALTASSCSLLGFVNGSSSALSIATGSRLANTIRYTTPVFSGFTGQLGYSSGVADGVANPAVAGVPSTVGAGGGGGLISQTGGNTMNARLSYDNGPIKGGFSYYRQRAEDRTAGVARNDQTAYTLMGDYNFGMATVGLTYDVGAIETGLVGGAGSENKRTAWSIPVTVPMGAGTILVTYTKANNAKVNGATVQDSSATMLSLGYDYALSKRTSIGASYATISNKANAGYGLYTQAALAGTPLSGVGQKASQLYVGVRHTF